jgi:hypothetical protein
MDTWERIWMEAVVGQSFGSCLGGTDENPRETSVSVVGVPAEIQTEHLMNRSPVSLSFQPSFAYDTNMAAGWMCEVVATILLLSTVADKFNFIHSGPSH